MRITEEKLRRIIREEIAGAYGKSSWDRTYRVPTNVDDRASDEKEKSDLDVSKSDADWKNPSKRDRARLGIE